MRWLVGGLVTVVVAMAALTGMLLSALDTDSETNGIRVDVAPFDRPTRFERTGFSFLPPPPGPMRLHPVNFVARVRSVFSARAVPPHSVLTVRYGTFIYQTHDDADLALKAREPLGPENIPAYLITGDTPIRCSPSGPPGSGVVVEALCEWSVMIDSESGETLGLWISGIAELP